MRLCFIVIPLLFLDCHILYAGDLKGNVGTSANYLNINDDNYEYVSNSDQFKLSSISVGLSYKIDQKHPILISATTNRLFNQPTSRQVVNKKTGRSFENRTKTTADTLILGYQLNRFIPAVFISNVGVDKRLYRDNEQIDKTKQHTLLYGFQLTCFYDKALAFSAAFLAPNQELGLETGVVLTASYHFNLL